MTRVARVLALLLGLTFVRAAAGEQKEVSVFDTDTPARLGRGYNSATGEVLYPCIDTSSGIGKLIPNGSGTGGIDLFTVDGTDSLTNKMSVNLDVLASFLGAKAGASFTYTRDTSNTSTWSHAVARSTWRNLVSSINHETWDPTIQELSNKGHLSRDDFSKLCGNYYIWGVISGAQYWGIFDIHNDSAEIKTLIDAKLTAEWAGSHLDARAINAISSLSKTVTVTARALRWGGTEPWKLSSAADLVADASNVPAQANSAPYPLAIILRSYDTLPQLVSDPYLFREQERVMQDLARQYTALLRLSNDAQFARDNRSLYDPTPDESKIIEYIQTIESDIDTINKAASACYQDIRNCKPVAISPWPTPFPLSLKHDGSAVCVDGQEDPASCIAVRKSDGSPADSSFSCGGKRSCQGKTWGPCTATATCECKNGDQLSYRCPVKTDNSKFCARTTSCSGNTWGPQKCDDTCVCEPNATQAVTCANGCAGHQLCNGDGTGLTGSCESSPPCPAGYNLDGNKCALTAGAEATQGFGWMKTWPDGEKVEFSWTAAPEGCSRPGANCWLTFTLGQGKDCVTNGDPALTLTCYDANNNPQGSQTFAGAAFATNGESGAMTFACNGVRVGIKKEKNGDYCCFKGCPRHMGNVEWHAVIDKTCPQAGSAPTPARAAGSASAPSARSSAVDRLARTTRAIPRSSAPTLIRAKAYRKPTSGKSLVPIAKKIKLKGGGSATLAKSGSSFDMVTIVDGNKVAVSCHCGAVPAVRSACHSASGNSCQCSPTPAVLCGP